MSPFLPSDLTTLHVTEHPVSPGLGIIQVKSITWGWLARMDWLHRDSDGHSAVLQGDFSFLKMFWEEAAVAPAPWAHGHCLQPSWVFYFEPRGLFIPQETF